MEPEVTKWAQITREIFLNTFKDCTEVPAEFEISHTIWKLTGICDEESQLNLIKFGAAVNKRLQNPGLAIPTLGIVTFGGSQYTFSRLQGALFTNDYTKVYKDIAPSSEKTRCVDMQRVINIGIDGDIFSKGSRYNHRIKEWFTQEADYVSWEETSGWGSSYTIKNLSARGKRVFSTAVKIPSMESVIGMDWILPVILNTHAMSESSSISNLYKVYWAGFWKAAFEYAERN